MTSEGQNGNKMKRKRDIFSYFGVGRAVRGGGGGGGGVSNSRERSFNFSLDFPAFGPSDRIGLRSKVVLRGKGYAWAPVLGSFDNSKR